MFNRILKHTVIFLAIFLTVNAVFGYFQGNEPVLDSNVTITTTKNEYPVRKTVTLEVYNGTSQAITLANNCPTQPLRVYKKENNKWIEVSHTADISCQENKEITIESGKDFTIPYNSWHYSLFGELGRYRIDLETTLGEEPITISSNEFTVVPNGTFWQSLITLFYKPIYNGLIYLTYLLPGHGLGWAIILLTLIIRTLLLIPSHKALKAQKKMQEIQPRLEKIREKYKGDQQRIAAETMLVWKEAKVNPAGSCLPMLMQFPFLITLFYVVRNVSNPDTAYYLYSSLAHFNLSNIDVNFLNILDLTTPNTYVLPLIIGGLQFFQIKLTMAKKGNKKPKNEMAKAQSMTMYFMPVMIAVFTASLPAGIGIYWGTSTTYGILQQLFINKGGKSGESTVKVINN